MWTQGGGRGSSCVTGQELGDVDLLFSSDGEELFPTDVTSTRLCGTFSSDGEGFSTDVSETSRKQPRVGVHGASSRSII